MVSTALILLSGRFGAIVAVPTAVILAREIAVSALREWMASNNNLRDVVQVGYQGKIKTALTMVALTVFLAVSDERLPAATAAAAAPAGSRLLWRTALALTYASMAITVTSGSVYFKAAAPHLRAAR
jgi:phosphatidylglycerophosphate synthase